MRIFNRVSQKQDPLFDVLEKMLNSNEYYRAIACNVMHEPRLSQERIDFFLGSGPCGEPEDLTKLLAEYGRRHIQQTQNPDFENSHNVRNRVATPSEPLVSILIINGLSRMFLWARKFTKAEIAKLRPKQQRAFLRFSTYPNHDSPGRPDSLDFVTRKMRNQAERREFLDVICTLYESYRTLHPYHPIWLTRWSDFRVHWKTRAADKANRWCDLLGVSTSKKEGQWVVILRFHARQLRKKTFHPTVLEAGNNAFHFPAPEGVEGGGRAADLRTGSAALAVEYIARWPSLMLANIDFARGCAQVEPLLQNTITKIRRHHIRRLRAEFGRLPEALEWLNRIVSH